MAATQKEIISRECPSASSPKLVEGIAKKKPILESAEETRPRHVISVTIGQELSSTLGEEDE